MKKAIICFSAVVMLFCLSGLFVYAGSDDSHDNDAAQYSDSTKDVLLEKTPSVDEAKNVETEDLQKNENKEEKKADSSTEEQLETSDGLGKERIADSDLSKTYPANSWVSIDGKTYYAGADGKLISGVAKISGDYYYFDTDSKELEKNPRWINYQGNIYHSSPGGKLYKERFIHYSVKSNYYLQSNATVARGPVLIGNSLYCADTNTGEILKQARWVNYGNKSYYVNSDGVAYRNRFIHFSVKSRYYLYGDGTVAKGIFKVGSNIYFGDPNTGEVLNKARWIDYAGERYHSNNEGALYKNRSIHYSAASNYYLDSNGKLLKGLFEYGGKTYCGDPQTGEVLKKSRWVDLNGKRYHTDRNGALYKGRFIHYSTASDYYLAGDGSLQKGVVSVGSRLYFADPKTGEIFHKSRWIEYNGNRYMTDTNGMLYAGRFVSDYRGEYYLHSNGRAAKGWSWIGEFQRYFHPETGLMYVNTTVSGIKLGFDGIAMCTPGFVSATRVLDSIGWNLRNAFNYASATNYAHREWRPTDHGIDWLAQQGFNNRIGNCYVQATMFGYMARLMGYDARLIEGDVPSRSGGFTAHSWVEIYQNGSLSGVYDPNFAQHYPGNGYNIRYGQSGTWVYVNHSRYM